MSTHTSEHVCSLGGLCNKSESLRDSIGVLNIVTSNS